jgi:hypothetical protein
MTTPIDRLEHLAAQRTARTDRLHEATCALLTVLEKHVERGASVRVEGHALQRVRIRSNVGYSDLWAFGDDDRSCYLDRAIGEDSYLHGDFNCQINGPDRGDLLAFATRAPRFVAAFIEREEKTAVAMDNAEKQLAVASDALRGAS